MKPNALATLLLLAVLAAPIAATAQDHGGDQDTARRAVEAGSQVPLSRVLATIAKRYPGRQLNTTMGQAGGRPVYLVQWQLTNGQVVVFTVDATTGQMMGQ